MRKNTHESDTKFMHLALREAQKGKGRTSPNPCVGAVVVKNGRVVGRGYTRPAGERHAEYFALREAGQQSKGATIYTTLEPCCYHGRTPPCTEEIIAAKVKRVVSAIVDPNPLVNGSGFTRLQHAGLQTTVGVCADEASRQMEEYLKYITQGMPFVTLKLATTLDGKIATRTHESKWITCDASRRYAHRLRSLHDAVLVGINTVLKDDPLLSVRCAQLRRGVSAIHQPVRIICDAWARTPVTAKMLHEASSGTGKVLLAVSRQAARDRVRALTAAGAQVVVAPAKSGKIDLAWLMRYLAKCECTSVLIEGGGEVAASALDSNIVDKAIFIIAPKIIGGREAVPAVGGRGVARICQAYQIRDWRVQRRGDDLVMQGYVKKQGC